MVDREKVVDGLQEAAAYFRSSFDAMYGTVACEKFRNWTDAIEQVIALLKAQEPRLMTLKEARSAFVIEYRSGKLKEVGMRILDIDTDPANAYYGVIYRVWTSRPTAEQMEAEPWD